MVNEPFKDMKKIIQLSLYENNISKMEGFKDLVNLRKLYLEKNLIHRLEEIRKGHYPVEIGENEDSETDIEP